MKSSKEIRYLTAGAAFVLLGTCSSSEQPDRVADIYAQREAALAAPLEQHPISSASAANEARDFCLAFRDSLAENPWAENFNISSCEKVDSLFGDEDYEVTLGLRNPHRSDAHPLLLGVYELATKHIAGMRDLYLSDTFCAGQQWYLADEGAITCDDGLWEAANSFNYVAQLSPRDGVATFVFSYATPPADAPAAADSYDASPSEGGAGPEKEYIPVIPEPLTPPQQPEYFPPLPPQDPNHDFSPKKPFLRQVSLPGVEARDSGERLRSPRAAGFHL